NRIIHLLFIALLSRMKLRGNFRFVLSLGWSLPAFHSGINVNHFVKGCLTTDEELYWNLLIIDASIVEKSCDTRRSYYFY
ncbi:MAG: hypothetical protein ACR2IS_17960, partial [Nitrososphaeraceae archaeon]